MCQVPCEMRGGPGSQRVQGLVGKDREGHSSVSSGIGLGGTRREYSILRMGHSRRRGDHQTADCLWGTICPLGGWGRGWDGSGEGPEPDGWGWLLLGLSAVVELHAPG